MRAITHEPDSAAPAPHIGYQIDRSFGPPMLFVEGDRRERPPLLTINVAHEHELLITDRQAHALHAALTEALGLQTSALSPLQAGFDEQHSIENRAPRLIATADDLAPSKVGYSYFGTSRQWLCATRMLDGAQWRAVGPTGGWLVFSSLHQFRRWLESDTGRNWDTWGRP